MSSTFRAAALFAALAAVPAHASGFYFGDNGSKALLQGGAFTAQADDLTAIQYNPAGLAQQSGVGVLIDAQLLNHETSFTRLDAFSDPNNPPKPIASEVHNSGRPFFLPFLGGSYAFEIANHRLTLALGLYGPPSVGRYRYPDPNYTKEPDANGKLQYVESPRKYSPQRYSLLNNDIIILYPSLSAAFQVHRMLSIGISAQLVVSHFTFRQALYSGLSTPTSQFQEDPLFDSVVNVNLDGQLTATGIIGVLFQPLDNLAIGASFRPRIPIRASGTLELELGEAAKGLNSVVNCTVQMDANGKSHCYNQTDLTLIQPLEFRLGARFSPIKRLGINADFVYQGWQSINEFILAPKDMTLKIGSGEAKPVAAFHIPKNWHASISFRLGASFDVIKYLTLHAGFFYETAAAPEEYTGIDFMHFDRFFISGGATVHLWKVDLVLGAAGTPTVNKAIGDSKVAAGSTDPEVPGSIVGNGLYASGGWILTAGLRGHFGGAPAAPPPAATEAPAPVEPAPAPASM